ncbi:hypothetical protein ONZ45_g11303 [Pleurotus djamor]|nr:hypothetical protein ONZ45_g11303 [Pleurotus djamor]
MSISTTERPEEPVGSTNGYAPFKVGDNTHKTWYQIFGTIGQGSHRPIVILHGGGGMSHHYMLPHNILASRLDAPVVFYDQIGNGQSTHLPDAPKEFFQVELWVDELDNLIKHLGIENDFDLIGNSWGGMLGGTYAATRMPPGLKNLVISNSPASASLMIEGVHLLLEKYPEEREILRKHAEAGTFASPEYQNTTQALNDRHFCRLDPKPKEFLDTMKVTLDNPMVFATMVGPSIYNLSGNIVSWSIVDKLPNVRCPTLIISSPHDVVHSVAILPWFQRINKVKWVELQDSTHMPMFEEPERYFEVLVEFLGRDDPFDFSDIRASLA